MCHSVLIVPLEYSVSIYAPAVLIIADTLTLSIFPWLEASVGPSELRAHDSSRKHFDLLIGKQRTYFAELSLIMGCHDKPVFGE